MNIIVPNEINLENEPFENVALFYNPEIGEFNVCIIRRGLRDLGSILKLKLDEIDKNHIGGSLIFLAEKATVYMENGIEGIEGFNIKNRAENDLKESLELLPLNCSKCPKCFDKEGCSFKFGGQDCLQWTNKNK